ncbi:MAG: toll/interleukin-1 receptor domain-containing protein [Acidobacteria bacterium]|nr:toll/interleukin-1 receptor domain-containing protein [Acidobacteriota bacterium]
MATESEYKHDVFISYNRADEAWAKQLATRLEQESWKGEKLKTFFAPWDIKPGESILERLEDALPRSRKVCLIMSPDSDASEWVKAERYITQHIDITERQKRLIPLYLRACQIPSFLNHINLIDFQDATRFEENYRILLATIKDEPLPRGSSLDNDNTNEKENLNINELRSKLRVLQQLRREELINESMEQEYQRRFLDEWTSKSRGGSND